MTELPPPPAWVSAASWLVRRLPAGRYRLMHRLCRRPPPTFLARLPAGAGGAAFACDLRDAIAREVFFTGRYESQETALVSALLETGHIFVDVGANWGYYTLLAAHRVGKTGRVLSLEPDPRLQTLLRNNRTRNDLEQVETLQVAASDRDGELLLSGYDERLENRGLSHLVEVPEPGAKVFQVSAQPLDALLDLRGMERVDLLKMDIEGAEDLALRGMLAGLAKNRYRRILLELHPDLLAAKGRGLPETLAPLMDAGYRGWRIDHTPETTRRAAYANALDPKGFLSPLDQGQTLDAWPHQLWTARDLEGPL